MNKKNYFYNSLQLTWPCSAVNHSALIFFDIDFLAIYQIDIKMI